MQECGKLRSADVSRLCSLLTENTRVVTLLLEICISKMFLYWLMSLICKINKVILSYSSVMFHRLSLSTLPTFTHSLEDLDTRIPKIKCLEQIYCMKCSKCKAKWITVIHCVSLNKILKLILVLRSKVNLKTWHFRGESYSQCGRMNFEHLIAHSKFCSHWRVGDWLSTTLL